MFDSKAAAYALLAKINYSDYAVPDFASQPPIAFWQRVCADLHNLKPEEGIRNLIEAASDIYPRNKKLAEYLSKEKPRGEVKESGRNIRGGNILISLPENISVDDVLKILEAAKTVAKDADIVINIGKPGSIILELGCSKETAKTLEALFQRRQFREVDGIPILSLKDTTNDKDPGRDNECAVHDAREKQVKSPIKIFISYSHRDESLVEEFQSHLAVLVRQGIVDTWIDRCIPASQDWKEEIDKQLDTA